MKGNYTIKMDLKEKGYKDWKYIEMAFRIESRALVLAMLFIDSGYLTTLFQL
jgi:hypothetical protein